jgi:hypothetical protein
MKSLEPARLLRMYDEGRITEMELRTRLVEAAASASPEEIARLLPAEQLQAIRDLTASPPGPPEDAPRTVCMGSWVGPSDHAAAQCDAQRLWHRGSWQWFQYFEGGASETPVCRN